MKQKKITDLDFTKKGIYRLYGIFVETNKKIGYMRHHVLLSSPIIEIDRKEVDSLYQDKGYGTMFMKHRLWNIF